jgi:hypothetical protein
MKALLTAIKTQLKTSLTYVRDLDIYITPDLDYIPEAVKFPAVAIEDGDVDSPNSMGASWVETLNVRIAAYVQLLKPEASVMGDTSTSSKGVLDMEIDILTALNDNKLSIAGMQVVENDPARPKSELVGNDNYMLVRKIVTMQYVRASTRP